MFQSPNGVQNAFAWGVSQSQQITEFQSPNGVQNAFPLSSQANLQAKFQSPNGVQNALCRGTVPERYEAVSITKRCTECFSKKIQKNVYFCASVFYIIKHLIDFLNTFI